MNNTTTVTFNYTCQAQFTNDEVSDMAFIFGSRIINMLGDAGKQRELSILPTLEDLQKELCTEQIGGEQKKLVVLLGSGVGFALEELLQKLSVLLGKNVKIAIVDKEEPVLLATRLKEKFKNVFWIQSSTAQEALKELTKWQQDNQHKPFLPLLNPFYLRLDRAYYDDIFKACQASLHADFWGKVQYRKFAHTKPRILLLTSKYFLIGEIVSACQRLGVENFLLALPEGAVGQNEFVEEFLKAVLEFKPDFVMTINHLGVDREGVLTSLLEKLRLPMASWFVDNPHLVLHLYARLVSPWVALFTWDKDNIASLKNMGFENTWYMPLGVDATRFKLVTEAPENHKWKTDISFVGNSMVKKVAKRMGKCTLPEELTSDYKEVAEHFSLSHERSVVEFLQAYYPEHARLYQGLATTEDKLGFETMLTWEATLQYRLSCVQEILSFNPLIVGDDGWFSLLTHSNTWRYHAEVNYYDDLPNLYPLSCINFNCTSKQMKGAVNQRVFDVPATGAFLLTDYREQVEDLFEVGKEIICFKEAGEIPELVAKYLTEPAKRQEIAHNARKRILAEHTYDLRLENLIKQMQKTFG